MRLRRLHPEPGEVDTDALPELLDLAARAPGDRPYVVANMVVSIDGRATVEGRSGPLGGEEDKELFLALRTTADAVLAGTGTMGTESYGRMVRKPERRARREAAGLAADPLAVVITRRGEVPWQIPLFEAPEQPVVVCSEVPVDPPASVTAQLAFERFEPRTLTPAAALRRLRAEHGVRSVVCEGGPTLLSALLHDGALDELFVTFAPLVAGGAEHTMLAGPPFEKPLGAELVWLLAARSELFARYALSRAE